MYEVLLTREAQRHHDAILKVNDTQTAAIKQINKKTSLRSNMTDKCYYNNHDLVTTSPSYRRPAINSINPTAAFPCTALLAR
jgi:hypothetical protein